MRGIPLKSINQLAGVKSHQNSAMPPAGRPLTGDVLGCPSKGEPESAVKSVLLPRSYQ